MKLSKISIPYRAGQKLIGIIVLLLFVGTGGAAASPVAVAFFYFLLVSALLLAVLGYEYLYWQNFEYKVEKDGLKIVSGVISKNDRDIPLKRIQNIDINRNIVQRLLGVAKADIETAGGGTTEASLKYVEYEDAQKLQQQVRELKNRRRSDTEREESGKERDDFVLSDKNLAILSLASVDLRMLAGIGLLLSVFGGSIGSQLEGTLPQTMTIGIVLLLGFFIMIGAWLSSAASKFIKYYDFRLKFHTNALEYERGLLNRASGTIPEEKIQDIIIEENVVQRYLGFASLDVETAGYSQSQGEIDSGSETVIPLATRNEVEKFAEEIGGYVEPELENVDEKARKRYFRRYLLAGASLAVIAFAASTILDLSWIIYVPAAIILLVSRKAAGLKWRNIGYFMDEKRVFTRKGFWNRRTYVIPYFRIQNFMETQTIFQRRWRQSTLLLDTAGSITSYPMIVDMDRESAQVLREELFNGFKQSLQR